MSNDTENQKDSGMSGAGSSLPAAAAALSAEDRVGLVNDLKNKLEILALEDTDIMGTLSPKVRKRVEALKELQSQHNGLETKFFEELAALEAKYQKLYEPHYEKRYEIVNGVVEVEGIGEEDKGTDKGVPEFWLQAMKNHELLAEEITERDEQALKYLKDIKWYKSDDPKGFKLEFFFDPNPFFKNTILTKTYQITVGVDPILEKAIGTNIEWHPGKCLTKKILKKKPKKGSKNAKPITKIEDCESFFNFFNPPKAPGDRDDIDEDEAEELMNILEEDYDIGSIIREKIIPHAVSWYTGEAEAVEEDGSGEEDDLNEEDNKAKEVNSLRN